MPHEMFLVCNPDVDKVWSVYALIDPRLESVFYIGITTNPRERVKAHRSSPDSAAYYRIKEIHTAGLQCIMKIVYVCMDKDEAERYERHLINWHPGLLNKAHSPLFPARRSSQWKDT